MSKSQVLLERQSDADEVRQGPAELTQMCVVCVGLTVVNVSVCLFGLNIQFSLGIQVDQSRHTTKPAQEPGPRA